MPTVRLHVSKRSGREATPYAAANGPVGSGRIRTAILVVGVVLHAATVAVADSPAQGDAAAAAATANRLLQAFDPAQARAAVLPPDSRLIVNWSNLPAGRTRFERNGVRIGDLGDTGRAALFEFLAAALSPAGAELVRGIIAAESALADSPRASRLGWHPDNYWLAFFGEPSADNHWSWQFGGHHLAINVAVTGGAMSMSPSFIGVEPAKFLLDGAAMAPLRDHATGGVALLGALSGEQRNAAIVAGRPRELYAGAGDDGVMPPMEGSRVAAWPAERQRQLLDLIGLWVEVMPPPAAERRLAEIESELPDVRFVWNGSADGSGSIYYRIPGPNAAHRVLDTGFARRRERPLPLHLPRSHQRIRTWRFRKRLNPDVPSAATGCRGGRSRGNGAL